MNGVIDHIDYLTGTGSTGSIRCGFRTGSATPATSWKLDGGTARSIPATPGTPGAWVTASRTGHTVTFTVVSPNTPPGAATIDLQGNQKATIWIRY